MSKIEELDQLDRAIRDSEIRLKSIQLAVEQNDKEIATLTPRKAELEKNIEFHKKSHVVPIAQEYKKAKTELAKVKARLIMVSADRKKAAQACEDIEEILAKFRRDHLELLRTSENNVLKPVFGGNRGKI